MTTNSVNFHERKFIKIARLFISIRVEVYEILSIYVSIRKFSQCTIDDNVDDVGVAPSQCVVQKIRQNKPALPVTLSGQHDQCFIWCYLMDIIFSLKDF